MTDHLRILVVEDDDALRALYVELLTADGHTVRTAADGEEGMTKLDKDIDLVITDLNMPRMTGDVFLSEMRNTRKLADIPVLVVTAFPEELPGSIQGPHTGVLRKPFELDVLTEYVDALAAGRAQPRVG